MSDQTEVAGRWFQSSFVALTGGLRYESLFQRAIRVALEEYRRADRADHERRGNENRAREGVNCRSQLSRLGALRRREKQKRMETINGKVSRDHRQSRYYRGHHRGPVKPS